MLEAALEAGADECVSHRRGPRIPHQRRKVSSPCATRWKPGWARRSPPPSPGGRRTGGGARRAGEKLIKLIEVLDDHDDVQNVYGNYELSDALMAKLAG